MKGKSQEAAAAAAGIPVRTARRWEGGPLPAQRTKARTYRTRPDAFAEVWTTDVVPLLEADQDRKLQGRTVLDELQRRYPGEYPRMLLRTLQRRVREWRALHGPDQEVVFPQEHPPGREAAYDFTHGGELGVTVAGEAFDHLLFTLKASCSGWLYAEVAFGETWEALCQGLQNGMSEAGGVFEVWRHDNLSAATRELKQSAGRTLTRRYQELLDHYDATSTRIRAGKPHENGVAEKGNDLLKTALDQALRLRADRDFPTAEAYVAFVGEVVSRENADREVAIRAELAVLKPLPPCRLPDYTVFKPTVRSWSTISVAKRTYSVPSRLKGHELEVHQYADRLAVYFQGQHTLTLPRLRGRDTVRVDYRHVVWSLMKKPGAFARYRFREGLFPSVTFRTAYDALVGWRGERADVEYVRILHLAASTMEGPVERALAQLLEQGERFDYAAVKAIAAPEPVTVPNVRIGAVDLGQYDRMLGGGR